MTYYNFVTNENLPSSRLDKNLTELSGWSRSKIQQLIKDARVEVNDVIVVNPNSKIFGFNRISINLPTPTIPTHLIPQKIPLHIIYEDDFLLVINKPAGMTVHPGNGTHNDTLVNALLDYCGDELSSINGEQRPGIVHRIDRDTTGLLLIAKNDQIHHSLAEQIAVKSAERHYLALVWGVPNPSEGTIITQIGRNRNDRTKMTVLNYGGKEAVTYYGVKQIFANNLISLVECKLATGRTHQLRVHMSHKGHSIVGDQVYGSNSKKLLSCKNDKIKAILQHFQRQALHAYFLSFTHPINKKRMSFTAAFPCDFQNLYDLLNY